MTDAAENSASLPHVRREDFIANLVTARGRGASYTAESVDAVIDNFVGNTNVLVDHVNELNSRPAETTVGAEDAHRLTREAQVLFEETSRTAASHIIDAQARAAKIVEDAEAGAKETTDAAHVEADRVTGEATAWAEDLHERTNAEIKAALDAAKAELSRLNDVREAVEARVKYATGRLAAFYHQQVSEVEAFAESVRIDDEARSRLGEAAAEQDEAKPDAAVEYEDDALPLEDADVETSVDEPVHVEDELAEKPVRKR